MRKFYSAVFGWRFVDEHAEDFAWGNGAGVYGLISTEDGVQGGLTQVQAEYPTGWCSYVRVQNVKDMVQQVANAGGRVLRAPFNVAGIGENALFAAPGGAVFGVTKPSYPDAPPKALFPRDVLLAGKPALFERFISQIGLGSLLEKQLLEIIETDFMPDDQDRWLPQIAVRDVKETAGAAQRHDAKDLTIKELGLRKLLADPAGFQFVVGGE